MNKKYNDDGIRSLFDSMEEQGGSFGMEERIMRAVQTEAKQQAIVRKHLQRALIGVGASLVLMVAFLLSTTGLFGTSIQQVSFIGFSDIYTIGLSLLALVLLFVEMELVVKYWYAKEREIF